jgi:hypothetical protein
METIQSKGARGRVADAPSGHWVYRTLPQVLWPYAQLARWDRPIGWWLLLWPCWWSAALAGAAFFDAGHGVAAQLPSVWHLALFLIGAIAMRGAGCTYNARGRCHPARFRAGRHGRSFSGSASSGWSCCCSSTGSRWGWASPRSARWRSTRS